MCDHVLGRGRVVIADVISGTGVGLRDRGRDNLGDILHMGARKHLTLFDDPAGGACTHLGKGATPGAVNARETKDVEREVRDCSPGGLGLFTPLAASGGGNKRCVLVHPSAPMVAVNARGRQITDPVQALGMGGNLSAERVQDRVPFCGWTCGDKHMARLRQGPLNVVLPRENQRLDPLVGQFFGLFCAAGGADDTPTLRQKEAGQPLGGIAVAEREKRLCHVQ
mmetsp:Transcript_24080/g.44526  ORF Transcript_24080/g.44526 Transcript_24080/m.44526 type:complete len:224 (+) Transcript_24080:8317-8988(+)